MNRSLNRPGERSNPLYALCAAALVGLAVSIAYSGGAAADDLNAEPRVGTEGNCRTWAARPTPRSA